MGIVFSWLGRLLIVLYLIALAVYFGVILTKKQLKA